jgi:hypothetical protein
MQPLFKKEDLVIVPRWTDNIKDEWIKPLILQACELYFYDGISAPLYDAIYSAVKNIIAGTSGLQWSSSTAYSINDVVLYNNLYYKALTTISSGEEAPSENPDWALDSLANFWAEFVKPYLIYRSYNSFLLWHGKHISQGGFRKHTDNTSFEISPDELGYLLGDTKSIIGIKEKRMMNYLFNVEYTFNGIQYEYNDNSKPSQGTFNIFSV